MIISRVYILVAVAAAAAAATTAVCSHYTSKIFVLFVCLFCCKLVGNSSNVKNDVLFCKILTEYFNSSLRLLQPTAGNLIISRVYILVAVAAAAAAAAACACAMKVIIS